MECGPLLAVRVRDPFVAVRREAERHDGEPLVPEAGLGLAALLTLAATRTAALSDSAESAAETLVAGYRLAFLVAAGVASLGVVAALYFFRQAKNLDT